MILDQKTVWKKIPNIPDRFEVSDSGLVRVLPHWITCSKSNGNVFKRELPGRYLNPYTRSTGKSKGHPVVSITQIKGDPVATGEIRVCLLVARAFHGSPYSPGDANGRQKWRVRHIDGDILNNYADNLEWVGNAGAGGTAESVSLYNQNLRYLERVRKEPVENWIRRIWGDDAIDGAA